MKKEPNDDTQYLYKRQIICRSASPSCVICHDKDIEIGQLKLENTKLHSDLISTNENIHRLNIEAEQKDISHRNQNDQQRNEIECLQKKLDEMESSSSDEYEVEKILKHERSFFVRWANYDSSHGSWVTEGNMCSEMVKYYFKSLKKK